MNLSVELHAEIIQGQPINWVAHTNRFHFPGWQGTAIAEGPSPTEALAGLHRELTSIASFDPSAPPSPPIQAEPLERLEEP